MSVYERVAAVMTDVTYLTRDCDMGEYWTLSDEKITSAVRASLIKNGLIIAPVAVEAQMKDMPMATVTYRVQGLNDDGFNVCMSGSGETLGAAITNAHKYMLLQVFNIPNGMEQLSGIGEKARSPRTRVLINVLRKICPDDQALNKMSGNLYGKPLLELTEAELQQMTREFDKLKGGTT